MQWQCISGLEGWCIRVVSYKCKFTWLFSLFVLILMITTLFYQIFCLPKMLAQEKAVPAWLSLSDDSTLTTRCYRIGSSCRHYSDPTHHGLISELWQASLNISPTHLTSLDIVNRCLTLEERLHGSGQMSPALLVRGHLSDVTRDVFSVRVSVPRVSAASQRQVWEYRAPAGQTVITLHAPLLLSACLTRETRRPGETHTRHSLQWPWHSLPSHTLTTVMMSKDTRSAEEEMHSKGTSLTIHSANVVTVSI